MASARSSLFSIAAVWLLFILHPALIHAQIKPMGQKGATRAVVVGIADYQNPNVPNLNFADADARAFAGYLRSPAGGGIPEEQVKLLTNEQATQGQIAAALTWLLEESREGDEALIFFSGHGDMETQTMMNYGFLLAYDAPASTYMAGGAFPVFYLQSIIQTLSTQKKVQVIMIADACHSGKLAGSAIGGAQATAKILADQFANETKMLSCQPNEFSLEGREWGGGHGVFTYYLIDGLTGLADANGDLSVSVLEIQRFLEDNVPAATAPHSQIPLVFGNKGMVVAKVDEPTLAALKVRRLEDQTGSAMASVITKTGANPLDQDSITMALYRRFQASLQAKHLLYPEEDAAYSIYMQIKERPAMANYRQEMRRNLAAALQDDAQQAVNEYLAASPQELRRRWSYHDRYERFPEYLGKAAEVLGPDHFMYNELKTRELYFTGLNLRLKGEQEKDAELFHQATALQGAALQLDSNAAYAINELGLLARRAGDYESSISYFQKALALSPTWTLAETNLCGSYIDLGRPGEAVQACEKALQIDSTFALAHHNLGVAFMEQSQRKKAIKQFQKALQYDPNYPMTYLKLGTSFYFENDYENAKIMFLECLRVAPENAFALYNLGLTSAELGQNQEALEYFHSVSILTPENVGVYYNIAELQMKTGRYEEAEAALQTSFRIAPDLPDGHLLQSLLRALQNQPEASLDALKTALEKGFRDYQMIQTAPPFDSLRQTDRFKDLMKMYFLKDKR
jgi:tetratricopeptide (TPR) repeat protein